MGIRRDGGFIILFSLARAVVVFRFRVRSVEGGKNSWKKYSGNVLFCLGIRSRGDGGGGGGGGSLFFFATKNPESLLRVTFVRWSRIEFLVVGD